MNKNDSASFLALAVLIDADNVSSQDAIVRSLEKIKEYGTAFVKRAYGNWNNPRLKQWEEVLEEHSIQKMQQPKYNQGGKNAADIALIIDAMYLFHVEYIDALCLVSGDSDFTPLAAYLRENGVKVYGFGEREKTSEAFRKECYDFNFIPVAHSSETGSAVSSLSEKFIPGAPIVEALCSAIEMHSDSDGWALLNLVGHHIREIREKCGCKTKLSKLIEKTGRFELKWEGKNVCFAREKKNAN